MIAEYAAKGETGLYTGFYETAWDGFDAYAQTLRQLAPGGWPFPEVVPGDTMFIIASGRVVGEVYLRYALTPALERDGGNIGYQIRPGERAKGYATQALRLALEHLGKMGLRRALLTCSDKNAASIRVIERCGGVRIDDSDGDDGGTNRRYWLATQGGPS